MSRSVLHFFLLVLLTSFSFASSNHEEDLQSLRDAQSKADVFELPSFRLKANVTIDNDGKPLEGSYTLLWNGPDQWREELVFPGFSEIKVGGKGVVATKRNVDFTPLRVEQVYQTLSYGHTRLLPEPGQQVKRVHDRTVRGTKVECFDIRDKERSVNQVCIDPSSGTWLREGFFEDSGIAAIGNKFFPRSLHYVENGKTLVNALVTEIVTPAEFPATAFAPPEGAESKAGCISPIPGRVVKRVPPQYPEGERQRWVEGTVSMYARIAADGTLQGLRLVSGVSPALNQASVDAVRQWQYEPYTCDGAPVEVETVIRVNFSLRR